MSALEWIDAPNCSTGHPFADRDEHAWRAPEEPPTDRAWVPYRTCSFCGSMHPEDLLAVLNDKRARCLTDAELEAVIHGGPIVDVQHRMPSITIEWADFKYGWPHKLYVRHNDGSSAWGKFYSKHLFELPTATFEAVAEKLAEKTRVLFERDAGGTKWRSLAAQGTN